MDVTPTPVNLDPNGVLPVYSTMPIVLAGYEPNDDTVDEIDVQWRQVGAGSWNTRSLATSGSAPFLRGVDLRQLGLAAGMSGEVVEWQVRGHEPSGYSPWINGDTFTISAPRAAAFPFATLLDQWGDAAPHTLTAAELNARLVDQVNALAQFVVGWNLNNPSDMTRQSEAGIVLGLNADVSVGANTPIPWDALRNQSKGYPLYWGRAWGGSGNYLQASAPGRYRVSCVLHRSGGSGGTDVSLNGLPSRYGVPTDTLTDNGQPAAIDGYFQLDGTELLDFELDTTTVLDSSLCRLSMWRVGQ